MVIGFKLDYCTVEASMNDIQYTVPRKVSSWVVWQKRQFHLRP